MQSKLTEFIVRSPQLRGGDIFTEHVKDDGPSVTVRQVLVHQVSLAEIVYRGEYIPAYLVTGSDLKTKKRVAVFAATRRLWAASREV
jgi:hypothetical protein